MAEYNDAQTTATIWVEEWNQDGNTTLKREFINTVGFSYSSDVLNLGDPFGFRVANPKGKYNQQFQRGSRVKFMLRNPNVNGGRLTLKHDGVVVNRTLSCDMGGCFLDVQCADLGWHLRENDAPLWYVLQFGRLDKLLTDPKFIDPSWGLKGLVTDTETTKLIRRGKNQGRAQVAIDQQALLSTIYIQAEPGDKIVDLIMPYCRRIGRLFTVSPDGYMQVFKPRDEFTAPLYTINFHGFDEPNRSLNSILNVHIPEDTSNVFTEVTCIGESTGTLAPDSSNQNALKRRATFVNSQALPFLHRKNFADGDIFDRDAARKQALWAYNRGIFDSWSAIYTVRGHHQQGNWWESDECCTVLDSVNGLDGTYYVQSVVYTRDASGDRTQVTLRKPGFLQASYGVFRRPPRYSAPKQLVKTAQEFVKTSTDADQGLTKTTNTQ